MTNKITLCTIILPRLEVFFIEDWINHNLSLGVSKIKIYNNGEIPVSDTSSHWRSNEGIMKRYDKTKSNWNKWEKKPNLNYFDEVPFDEIENKLNNLQKKYKQVEIISWVHGKDHESAYPSSQTKMLGVETKHTQKGWLLNLDPDEYLHLDKYNNNLNDLINENQGFNYFYFNQYRAERRKIGIPIEKLKIQKKFRLGAQKWMCNLSICNTSNNNGKVTVHKLLKFKDSNGKRLTKDEGYFVHYKN